MIATTRPDLAKLTPAQVAEILGKPELSLVALAAEYGVHHKTIANIRKWRSWKIRT